MTTSLPSPYPEHIIHLATKLVHEAGSRKIMVSMAESCTGGLIAGSITDVPGSSAIFDRGFVTYSYEAKTELLGVNADELAKNGAVSEVCAAQMVEGVLARSPTVNIAVAVTGIAGPGGATPDKPVGLVYIAVASRATGKTDVIKNLFSGNRNDVRMQTVETALGMLLKEVESVPLAA